MKQNIQGVDFQVQHYGLERNAAAKELPGQSGSPDQADQQHKSTLIQ